MAEVFANGARGRLLADISAGATSMSLRAGQGALFPAYGVGDYSWLTLEQGPAANPTKREIVQVTARSSDTLTIARAQQGTSALAFDKGARCELRFTARTLADLQEAMGFNRKFPSAGIAPEATSSLNQYGLFDGCNPAAFTRPTPSTSLHGFSKPRLSGTRIAANSSVVDQNTLGTAGAPTMLGGMELLLRFTIDNDVSGTRKLLAIGTSTNASLLTTLNPSALTAETFIGLGHDDTSSPGTAWMLFHNKASTVSQINTGINRTLGHEYQLRIWSPRGVAKWYVELIDFDAAGARFFQSLTSNVPICGDPMRPMFHSRRPSGTDDFSLIGCWGLLW